jgi:alpha-1,2-mannosyltransferase
MNSPFFASWLRPRRFRAHGQILAICLWLVYLWNMATPGLRDRAGNLKGTDFLHFYTLGSLALDHRGSDLYNMQAQSALAAQRVAGATGIYYLPLYPPQVSMFFAPLAKLPYGWSLACWLLVNTILYGFCCYAIWRVCPNLRDFGGTVLILALAFPAFWHLIAWGQTGVLALVCFTLLFLALRGGLEFLGGMALGCLIFKPQLALTSGIVFLARFRWKILAGALLSAFAQLMVGVVYYGFNPLWEWLRTLLNSSHVLLLLEPRVYQTYSLRTFWGMLVPWPWLSLVLYAVSAAVVCMLAVKCWRNDSALPLGYSALLLGSALISPHLTVYDLVILAPIFLLLSDWMIGHPETPSTSSLKSLLYCSFALPLFGPLSRWTHVQLFVPAAAGLLVEVWRFSERPSTNGARRLIPDLAAK